MTKSKGTMMKRLGRLVPDVEKIQKLYKIDQDRAKLIYIQMCAEEDKIRALLSTQKHLTNRQADYIEKQAETAKAIDWQVGKERDALQIFLYIDLFITGDHDTKRYFLSLIFKNADEFADVFGSLPDETQIEYFNALRKGINSLKKQDGLLLEPVA